MGRQITITTPWGASHDVTVPDGASDQDIASYIDKVGPDMAKADGAKGAFMFDQNGQNKRWVDAAHMPDATRNGWQTSQPTQFEQNAPKIPNNYGFTPGHMAGEAVEGVKDLGKGAVQMASDVGGVILPKKLGGDSFMDNQLSHDIGDPMNEQVDKSRKAFARGNNLEGTARAVFSGVPVLGPMAAQLYDKVGSGDAGGGLSYTGAQVAAPEVAGEVAPLLKKGAGKVVDNVATRGVDSLIGTTPERIAELKQFPQKVEGVRQTVVNAERNAHAAAKAAYPQFDQPIEIGRTTESVDTGLKDANGQPVTKTVEQVHTTTWKALQEERSNLVQDIASEKRAVANGSAPRFDLAKMYEKLNDLDNTMGKAALEQGGPEGVAQLEKARQSYRQYMDDFHNPGAPLRSYLDFKPGQTDAVINQLTKPDGARAVEALRRNGVNTGEIEGMLQGGNRPLRVTSNESAKLRKAGSDTGYTRQRLNESLSQVKNNELPSQAEARLPAKATRSKLPSVASKIPFADKVSPRAITKFRLERALSKLDGN